MSNKNSLALSSVISCAILAGCTGTAGSSSSTLPSSSGNVSSSSAMSVNVTSSSHSVMSSSSSITQSSSSDAQSSTEQSSSSDAQSSTEQSSSSELALSQFPSDIVPNLNRWKISLPVDKNGDDSAEASNVDDRNTNSHEVKDDDLLAWDYPPYFYAHEGEIYFRAHCAGATTSGSQYPRSELRQRVGGGDNYWSVDDYQHLSVDLRVVHTPVVKPELSLVQIHGPDDEPLRVQYHAEDGVYLIWNESNKEYNTGLDYELGGQLRVDVTVENGDITTRIENLDNGNVYTKTWASNDNTGYFKVGAYTQSSIFLSEFKSNFSENEALDAYGEIAVSRIELVETYNGQTTGATSSDSGGEQSSSLQASSSSAASAPSNIANNLDADLPPSGNFDLATWKLDTPRDEDGDGKGEEIKEGPLSSGFEDSDFFFTGADGGMVFRATVAGGKTSSGTSYTRSELREMLRRGDTSHSTQGVGGNNWVFGTASAEDRENAGGVDGALRATLAVNHVTTTGSSSQIGRVIVGQIHANDDEPARLYYRKLPGNSKGAIYLAHEPRSGSEQWYDMIGSRSSSADNPEDGIALDEVFSYEIRVEGDILTVTIFREGKDDVVQVVDMSSSGFSDSGQYMYFKAGVYNQNNSGDDNDYAQATFYALSNTHD